MHRLCQIRQGVIYIIPKTCYHTVLTTYTPQADQGFDYPTFAFVLSVIFCVALAGSLCWAVIIAAIRRWRG